MRSALGLLVFLVIALLTYKFYFSKMQSDGGGTPTQTINAVGAKNDILAIAQSERAYQAEHGAYGSLDDLAKNSAMSTDGRRRDGYTYDLQTTSDGFRVTARCAVASGCTSYFVDQTMEVQAVQ